MARPGTGESGTLTTSQEVRRQRVIQAAHELAAEGGYDAVQMRDVAGRADVALGTIYRYFTSKDALLASAMVEWMAQLEATVQAHPPQGATTAERITDVTRRAVKAMEHEPKLTRAVITALTAGDPVGVDVLTTMIAAFARTLRPAFPDTVDPEREASAARMVGHVWWSTMVCWASGMGDMAWVSNEVAEAARLIAGDT